MRKGPGALDPIAIEALRGWGRGQRDPTPDMREPQPPRGWSAPLPCGEPGGQGPPQAHPVRDGDTSAHFLRAGKQGPSRKVTIARAQDLHERCERHRDVDRTL